MKIASFDWLCLIILWLVIVDFAEPRYLKRDGDDDAADHAKTQKNSVDDDVDLETVVDDYYDDLWQHLVTTANRASESKKKLAKEDEEAKPKSNFTDYDYMSDMAVAEPNIEEKKFKTLIKDPVVTDRENWTFANGPSCNETYGESQISDYVRASHECNSEEEFDQRSKKMRINSIISQVLSFRGGSPKPNETVPVIKHFDALREIYEKNMKKIKTEEWTSSYNERIQSFYPSCDVPRNTDEDVWFDPYSMNLLFDLYYPIPQDDSTIMIVSAKLRLYKLPQENNSTPNSEINSPKAKPGLGILPADEDRQIRVSVYWYTKSLRRHRAKKKLLDSQMLSVYAAKWADFNIRTAVRTWKDSGRNFGLVVTVEDEDGTLLPAEQYVQTMNCSKWTATLRPIPSIIIDKVNQYFVENYSESKNETSEESKRKVYPYEPVFYPTIDLHTREVPNSELKNLALVNSAKIALESKFFNLSRRGYNVSNNSITVFLKNYNADQKDISNLSKFDKSNAKKVESKSAESRISYFQNVPIGSPSANQNRKVAKKNHGSSEETVPGKNGFSGSDSDGDKEERVP